MHVPLLCRLTLALSLRHFQVYYISRGKVKPANKAFAAVRNDYTINLDNGYFLLQCHASM